MIRRIRGVDMKLKKRDKQSLLISRRERLGYVFVAPFAIGFLLLMLYPMLQSLIYSFCELVFDGSVSLKFIGLKNYKDAFLVDTEYRQLLLDSVRDMALSVPVILIFSLLVAVFLNKNFVGKSVYQIIFFIPVILSSGILPGLFENDLIRSSIINASSAAGTGEAAATFDVSEMTEMLISMNLPETLAEYIMYGISNILEIINSSGIQILVFTMALKSIPAPLYEASDIEGATAWENFWKITLPMIMPQMLVNVTYTVIDAFVNNTNPIMQSINAYNYSKFNFGYAAGLAWAYFVIILAVLVVFAGLVNLFAKRYQ